MGGRIECPECTAYVTPEEVAAGVSLVCLACEPPRREPSPPRPSTKERATRAAERVAELMQRVRRARPVPVPVRV